MNCTKMGIFVMTCCMLACGRIARAGPLPPMPAPISSTIERADVIVVAGVTGISVDAAATEVAPTKSQPKNDPNEEISRLVFQKPGQYTLRVKHLLKGKCDDAMRMHMPLLSSFYYGRTQFDLAAGSTMLLLLRRDGTEGLVPVDPLMPLIPLSPAMDPLVLADGQTAKPSEPDALDFLLASLADQKLRPSLAYVLRAVKDKRCIAAMRPFADDNSIEVRVPVLQCLALNQDVTVIPKIASTVDDLEKQFGGTGLTSALKEFKDPQAVPFLNTLVNSNSTYVRINAMTALRPIADETSVPFLMKALETDDDQHVVAYDAYYALHRIVGRSMSPALSVPQFNANRDSEIQKLKQWWEWEQVKQKKATAATSTAPTSQPATASASSSA